MLVREEISTRAGARAAVRLLLSRSARWAGVPSEHKGPKLMRLLRIALTTSLVLAACDRSSDVGPADPSQVGALAVHLTDLELGAELALYRITGPGMEVLTGVVDLKDGVIDAMVTGIPAGADRGISLELIAGGHTVCTVQADSISIDVGRSAQIALPACGAPATNTDGARKKNHAPQISAVFASRSLAQLHEHVAVAVAVSDRDGDPLTFAWTASVPGSDFTSPTAGATGWNAGPFGASNTLTVTVRDGRGGVTSAHVVVDVEQGVTGPATCGTPDVIAIGDRVRGLTLGGTSELSPTACAGFAPSPGGMPDAGVGGAAASEAPERVFKLVLATTQTFSVSTVGSAFNAVAYVRQGGCVDGTEIGCRQTFEFPQGLVFENAAPGTYFIVVDGVGRFDRGEFVLQVGAGALPEDCQNGNDDDGDGNFDCADDECGGKPGCLECAFDCNPDPNDCFAGACDRFTGRCFAFPEFGTVCEADGNPATAEVCADGICQVNTAVCGDGLVEFQFGEQCDDGNTVAGDGCEPNCQPTTCGGSLCDDGNSCTADSCTDPATATCSFAPVADGTACEVDGDPATADTCQAGSCVAQPAARPDPALIVLDPIVMNDPAFSLKAMHDRLAADGNGAALFEQWSATLAQPLMINGDLAAPRIGFTSFVAGLPRGAGGLVDLQQAGFRASAFVNRIDLRAPGTCGESRVVFTKETGVTDGGNRMTLIFEFGVPDDGTGCRTISARWAALRGLAGEPLRAAAVALMLDNSRRTLLNQFRTNDFIQAPFWELRQFSLGPAGFTPAPVGDTPPFALQTDPTFRQFVIANAPRFNAGARETGIIPLTLLGAASNAGGQRFEFGSLVPSLPGLTANFNIMTCSGCHLTETGTSFVHVAERTEDQPSNLSFFLRSELGFRATVLEALLPLQP